MEAGRQETAYDKLIYWSLTILVVALPLVIMPTLDDSIALPKITLLRLLALGMLTAWAAKTLLSGKLIYRRTPLDLPVAILASAFLISTVRSIAPRASLLGLHFMRHEGLITWFLYFALYFVATNHLETPPKALRVTKVMTAASAVVAGYAITQHFGYSQLGLESAGARSSATLGNPLFLAGYLVLVLPLSLSFSLAEARPAGRLGWLGIFLLDLTALVFTYGRGAWIGAVCGLGVVVFSRTQTRSRQSFKRLALFLALALLVTVTVVYVVDRAPGRDTSVLERITSAVKLKGSVASRLSIWDSTLFLVSERIGLGWGPETLRYTFSTHRKNLLGKLEGVAKTVDRPHNQPLYMAYATGIPGLLAYLWIVGSLVCLFARWLGKTSQQANQQTSQHAALLVGLFGASVGYLVQEQFSFSQIGTTPLFWILLGMLMSNTRGRQIKKQLGLPLAARQFLVVLATLALFIFSLLSLSFFVADYYYRQGLLQTKQMDHTPASKYFEKALRYNSWSTRYRFALGESYNALAANQGNLYWLNLADRTFARGVALNPRDYELRFGLGNTHYLLSLLRNDTDYSLAKEDYQKTIELEPFFADSYVWIGKILISEGNYRRAVETLQTALKLDPTNFKALEFLSQANQGLKSQE